MRPDYYSKAVPVLTPHVYRLADLVNSSAYVLLPGEATMYVGSDFVGRMNLPLVAIGERYTVGFGVDPQLQASRQLVKKSRTVQGGNQVHSYEYRITVSSYKSEPVRLQVWDRLPRAEAEAVAVSLVEPLPKLERGSGLPAPGAAREPAALGPDGRAGHERREGGDDRLPVQAGVRPRRGDLQLQGQEVAPWT